MCWVRIYQKRTWVCSNNGSFISVWKACLDSILDRLMHLCLFPFLLSLFVIWNLMAGIPWISSELYTINIFKWEKTVVLHSNYGTTILYALSCLHVDCSKGHKCEVLAFKDASAAHAAECTDQNPSLSLVTFAAAHVTARQSVFSRYLSCTSKLHNIFAVFKWPRLNGDWFDWAHTRY